MTDKRIVIAHSMRQDPPLTGEEMVAYLQDTANALTAAGISVVIMTAPPRREE